MAADCHAGLTALALLKSGASVAQRGTATVTGGSIAANSTSDIAVTVRGAMRGDVVLLEPPAALASGLLPCPVAIVSTTPGSCTLRVANVTTGAVTLASASWRCVVLRPTGS